jgi:hypothetical protein
MGQHLARTVRRVHGKSLVFLEQINQQLYNRRIVVDD